MSRVFLADEIALGRRVVLKVFPPELAAALSVDRFQREVRVAAGLQHPNIVPLLAAGSAGGVLYYTMPFVEGESLRSRLASEGELPVAEAVRLFREVADALAHATQAPAPLAEARPAVPPQLGAIVHRCLEKRPADRFQHAEELLAALDALTGALPAPSPAAREWPLARTLGFFALSGSAVLGVAWALRTLAG